MTPEYKETKISNPKELVGVKKIPMSTLSCPVIMEMALGMQEGSLKYGRHNYRVAGVSASMYYDAAMRHLMAWWEGEDIDPESGVSHVIKAMTSLCVLRDGMIQDKWTDDRPITSPEGWMKVLNVSTSRLREKYPDPVPPYTEKPIQDHHVVDGLEKI